MSNTNEVTIGQATYEISRMFAEKQTVSDIIRNIIISKSNQSHNLT